MRAADPAGRVAVQEASPPNLCTRRVGNPDQLELAVHRHGAVVVIRIQPGDQRRPPPRWASWQASVRRVDLRPHLGQISVPTLICVGRHDPQTPWPDNARIAAALPAGRLEVFERSGHYPFLEEPDRFTAVVGAFLASVS